MGRKALPNLRSPVPISPGRSRIMEAIRSKGNRTTEERMATLLRKAKISGWRRHLALPGRPDFAWPKEKVAVFVDGCFWHGCPRCYRPPRHNPEFWVNKLKSNRSRDRRVARTLRVEGWRVIRVWECRVMHASTLSRIIRALRAVAPRDPREHA